MRYLTFALALTACAPPPAPQQHAIVGGTLEMGEPAVVAVQAFGGIGLCTGTLITPQVVLTAKHCVQAPGAEAPFPATAITVGVGHQVGALTSHRARAVLTTPGSYNQDPSVGLVGAIVGVDVGLVVLRQPITDITPIPIRRDRPDDLVGQEFTAIGFGNRPDGPAGLKYRGTGTLRGINGSVLFSEMIICQGDSGGPMIQETPERRVVGVASFGEANRCPSSMDGYNGLFEHLDLIDRAIVLSGDCLGPSEEICNSLDDDCDESIDEGCAPLGAACEVDTDCAFGPPPAFLAEVTVGARCEDLGAGSVCTRPCDPTTPDACGSITHVQGEGSTTFEGAYCRVIAGCNGRCAIGARGDAVDGTPCTADDECLSQRCLDPGDGARRCLSSCRAGAGTCPIGEACSAPSEGCGACVDPDALSGARALGEPCGGDDDCAAGSACVDGACATACAADPDCAAGYRCDEGRCRRGQRAGTGEPCRDERDCRAGDRCIGGRCAHDCGDEDDCPEETSCGMHEAARVCVPDAPVLGEACEGACGFGATCDDGRCVLACGDGTACPAGFPCRRDDDGVARCAPEGGCAVRAARRGRGAWLWMAMIVGLVGWRRTRASARAGSTSRPWA